MGTQPKSAVSSRLIFGPFEFHEATGDLLKFGTRIRLQGQPLQILDLLLRRPGELVSREEFQQAIWRGSTFVDFDHGLNAAVNRLRQALSDSADQPHYIETVPGRGYRFIAPVQIASPKQVVSIPVRPAAERNWRRWAAYAGLAAALAAAYVAGSWRKQTVLPPPVRFTVSPPQGYVLEPAASRQSLALSPDGSQLAFTAMEASGLHSIFIRDLQSTEPRLVPDTTGAHSVFWGPDSRSLFYTSRGSVRRIDNDGAAAQVLGDAPSLLNSGSVLPDGSLLVSGPTRSFEFPINGGTARSIETAYRWPQVLPDGKHLLYAVLDPALLRYRIRIAELGKPETAREVLETDSRAIYAPSMKEPGTGYLLAVRAGNLLAHPFDPRSLTITAAPMVAASGVYSFLVSGAADFSVSANGALAYLAYTGRSQLAWVDRQGRTLRLVGPGDVNLKYAALSPDGTKIATAIWDQNRGVSDIWIVDQRTNAARVLFKGPGLSTSPVWSPDSKRLVYGRANGSGPKLYLRGDTSGAPEEALPPDFFQIPGGWSADDRYIVYSNTGFAQIENELQGDILLIDLHHRQKPIPLIATPFHEANPTFSPDGRWIAFTSTESGRAELYLQAFSSGNAPHVTGERFLVSRTGAACLRWRRDGKELYFVGADGKVYATPVRLSVKPEIGLPAPLFSISLEARGAVHALLGFDVSPDGTRFLVPVVAAPAKSEIVIVQNWESALGHH